MSEADGLTVGVIQPVAERESEAISRLTEEAPKVIVPVNADRFAQGLAPVVEAVRADCPGTLRAMVA